MSTIAVALKNGYAAIAADSLTKAGNSKDPADYIINHRKIFTVGENYLALAGATSTKLALNLHFKSLNTDISLESVDAIYRVWLHVHEELKDRYFLQTFDEDAGFESSRMDVLIANPYGIFGVDAYRCVQQFARFYAYGSGSTYAMEGMYTIYDDPEKSAEDIARRGVEAACTFDGGSGFPIYSCVVKLHESNPKQD